jgi:hypothetical protein
MSTALDAIREATRTILHDQHRRWREVVTGLDADALNWRPGDETNSIAVLVSHALDAERFLLASSVDAEIERDRESHFRVVVSGPDELLAYIDEVERDVDGYLDRLTDDLVAAEITRGARSVTGAWWALHAVEHSCEHIGHAELTRQMWEQRNAG